MADSQEYIDELLQHSHLDEGAFYRLLVELMNRCDRECDRSAQILLIDQVIFTYRLMHRRLQENQSAIADLYASYYCDMRHIRMKHLVSNVAAIDLSVITEKETEVRAVIKQLVSLKESDNTSDDGDLVAEGAKPITMEDKKRLATSILTSLRELQIGSSLADAQLRGLSKDELDPEIAIFTYLHRLELKDLGPRPAAIWEAFRESNVDLRVAPRTEREYSVGLSEFATKTPRRGKAHFYFIGPANNICGLWVDDQKLTDNVKKLTSRKGYDPHRAARRTVVSNIDSLSQASLKKKRSKGNA